MKVVEVREIVPTGDDRYYEMDCACAILGFERLVTYRLNYYKDRYGYWTHTWTTVSGKELPSAREKQLTRLFEFFRARERYERELLAQ